MTDKAQAERSPEESSPLSVDGIWTPLGQVLINECDHLFQYSGDPGRWPLRCCIACGSAAIAAALRAAEACGRERGIEEAAQLAEALGDWDHAPYCAQRIRALLANATPQRPEDKGAEAQFREQVYRLLVDGYGPGGGYYEPDQRLGAAQSLLTIGWGKTLASAAQQSFIGTPYEPCKRCGRTRGEHLENVAGIPLCPAPTPRDPPSAPEGEK